MPLHLLQRMRLSLSTTSSLSRDSANYFWTHDPGGVMKKGRSAKRAARKTRGSKSLTKTKSKPKWSSKDAAKRAAARKPPRAAPGVKKPAPGVTGP